MKQSVDSSFKKSGCEWEERGQWLEINEEFLTLLWMNLFLFHFLLIEIQLSPENTASSQVADVFFPTRSYPWVWKWGRHPFVLHFFFPFFSHFSPLCYDQLLKPQLKFLPHCHSNVTLGHFVMALGNLNIHLDEPSNILISNCLDLMSSSIFSSNILLWLPVCFYSGFLL